VAGSHYGGCAGVADRAQTGTITLDLAGNLNDNSASGMLLTATAVPEPESVALMPAGPLVTDSVAHRRMRMG
jgi:hypothetical protein